MPVNTNLSLSVPSTGNVHWKECQVEWNLGQMDLLYLNLCSVYSNLVYKFVHFIIGNVNRRCKIVDVYWAFTTTSVFEGTWYLATFCLMWIKSIGFPKTSTHEFTYNKWCEMATEKKRYGEYTVPEVNYLLLLCTRTLWSCWRNILGCVYFAWRGERVLTHKTNSVNCWEANKIPCWKTELTDTRSLWLRMFFAEMRHSFLNVWDVFSTFVMVLHRKKAKKQRLPVVRKIVWSNMTI